MQLIPVSNLAEKSEHTKAADEGRVQVERKRGGGWGGGGAQILWPVFSLESNQSLSCGLQNACGRNIEIRWLSRDTRTLPPCRQAWSILISFVGWYFRSLWSKSDFEIIFFYNKTTVKQT